MPIGTVTEYSEESARYKVAKTEFVGYKTELDPYGEMLKTFNSKLTINKLEKNFPEIT